MILSTLVRLSLRPLIALHVALAVVTGVWQIAIGEWLGAWPGTFFLMMSAFILPWVMMPGTMLISFATQFFAGKKWPVRFLMLGATAYFTAGVSLYFLWMFSLSWGVVVAGLPAVAILWTMSISFLPWGLMTLKDPHNVFFISLLLFMQVIGAFMIWTAFTWHWTFLQSFAVMWSVLTTMMLFLLAKEWRAAAKTA